MLFGVYKLDVCQAEKSFYMLAGFFVVLLICILSLIDRYDGRKFLRKVLELQGESEIFERISSGFVITVILIIIVNLFNLILLACKSGFCEILKESCR